MANAQELPPEVGIIVSPLGSTRVETANKDVLTLNAAMFELYGDASRIFKANILARHPVILALFTGQGGRFILHRPGQPPLEAPRAPLAYELLKSVGHSAMALAGIVLPYLSSPQDQSWRSSLLSYRSRMEAAVADMDMTDMPADWRVDSRKILENNVAFMDECAARRTVTLADLQAFADRQEPLLKLEIARAAQTQVGHWMSVVGEWKDMLGDQWEETYAASNTIYVTRQNNVLFSVLAQYFGPEAINHRLMLIETISFTTTPDELLDSMVRIVADRTIGTVFFGNSRLMDYELMGGDARKAIIAEAAKRGMEPFLPPAVPFGSHQWPMLVSQGPGPASLDDLPSRDLH